MGLLAGSLLHKHKVRKTPRNTGRVFLGHSEGQTGGLLAGVQGISCCLCLNNYQKRAGLPRHRPGVAGTPSRPGGLWKNCVFLLCPLRAPCIPSCFTDNVWTIIKFVKSAASKTKFFRNCLCNPNGLLGMYLFDHMQCFELILNDLDPVVQGKG